jgi:hypothetical protein
MNNQNDSLQQTENVMNYLTGTESVRSLSEQTNGGNSNDDSDLKQRVLGHLEPPPVFKSASFIANKINEEVAEVRLVLSGLIIDELAQSRRGRKGGFSLFVPENAGDQDLHEADQTDVRTVGLLHENEYYEAIREQIERMLADNGFIAQVAQTSHNGANADGVWSRPDIYAVARKHFHYYRPALIEYISYEVKLANKTDVRAVYETLNHRSAATKAFLIVVCTEEEINNFQEVNSEIVDLCALHGIGLILVKSDSVFEDWHFLLDARQELADPESIDLFLQMQFIPKVGLPDPNIFI